jgi:glycosyltransferase involved in cell wall biosynthesis
VEILLVSGIWPPDIGGPASHGPEVGRFLRDRGHQVRAVTTAGRVAAVDPGFPLTSFPRNRSRITRLSGAGLAVVASARRVDVIYAIGMFTRSAIAATLNSVPVVMKLVTDPAYERARRFGLFSGTMDEFQHEHGDARIRALKRTRDLTFKRAARIITPARYLERIGVGWGLAPERFEVIPNPAPPLDETIPREELRRRFDMDGPTFVFTGRFVKQKNVQLAVRALRHAPRASLVLIGEGNEKGAIEAAIAESAAKRRIAVRGALPLRDAMQWVRAADAAILPSDWEPGGSHAAIEALSVGTPAIATAVGAVSEIIDSGVNGLLVPPKDEEALGAAMASLADDADLLDRLRRGAAATGDRYAPGRAFAAIEHQLERALDAAGP